MVEILDDVKGAYMCKFCENFNFNKVDIDHERVSIYFAGTANDIPANEQFRFCPVCGKRMGTHSIGSIGSHGSYDSLYWCSKEFESAGTMAGEIIRAVNLIEYRYSSAGERIGMNTSRSDCNLAAQFLERWAGDAVKRVIDDMVNANDDDSYTWNINELKTAVAEFVDEHPELNEYANLQNIVRF